jgi:hypothetical protein
MKDPEKQRQKYIQRLRSGFDWSWFIIAACFIVVALAAIAYKNGFILQWLFK